MADYSIKVSIFLSVLFVYVRDGQGINCLSNSNQKIDWFLYYKPPLSHERDRRFYYMDSETPELTRSNVGMRQSNHALAYTLNSLKKENSSLMYLFYNDQTEVPSRRTNIGHSKGVTAFDDKEGFWLIHSAPYFPYRVDKYEWQASADRNGQTFLCVTMGTKQSLNNIGKQLKLYNPNVYYQKNASFVKNYSEMNDVIDKRVDTKQKTSMVGLRSSAGRSFMSFAKSRQFVRDIYSDLIAKNLRSNLYVQSWLTSSSKKLPSNCDNTFKVNNIAQIRLPKTAPFNSTLDHSKWAVSVKGRWTCIGDLNRVVHESIGRSTGSLWHDMSVLDSITCYLKVLQDKTIPIKAVKESQMRRGGGALCLDDISVGKQFIPLVGIYEPCPQPVAAQTIERSRKRSRSNTVEKAKSQERNRNFK